MNDVLMYLLHEVNSNRRGLCWERIQFRNLLNLCQSNKWGLSFACRITVHHTADVCLCASREDKFRRRPSSNIIHWNRNVSQLHAGNCSLCVVSSCHKVDVLNHQIYKQVWVHALETLLLNTVACGVLHSYDHEWKYLVDFNTTTLLYFWIYLRTVFDLHPSYGGLNEDDWMRNWEYVKVNPACVKYYNCMKIAVF
jgi:hypothetical protein